MHTKYPALNIPVDLTILIIYGEEHCSLPLIPLSKYSLLHPVLRHIYSMFPYGWDANFLGIYMETDQGT
jgi:hypothetical protein